jgi:hypothetical protein
LATPGTIKNMPGFIWVYQSAHGFRGRHSYNPNTGESLSTRQTSDVRDGKVRLEQALIYAAHPRRIFMSKDKRYQVYVFNTIYGMVRYARTHDFPAMYLVGYGKPNSKYKEKGDQSYLALSKMQGSSAFEGRTALETAYAKFDGVFDEPAKTPTFTLMVRVK